jgi:aspartyl-tRNA(Asn)/glutamyl-tRNA(Gln) amidotransferase subunit A
MPVKPNSSNPIVVGIPKEYFVKELPPDVVSKWTESIRRLQAAGYKVVDISLPHTAEALSAYYVIAPAEASSNLARYDGVRYGHREDGQTLQEQFIRTRTDAFGKEVQRRILMGAFALSRKYGNFNVQYLSYASNLFVSRSYESYYQKALQIRRLVVQDFDNVFAAGVDVILTPTSPVSAPSIAELQSEDPVNMYMMDVMTIPANMAGLPAISVPTGTSSSGLPVGFQLLSARFNEDTLLRAAETLEVAWRPEAPVLAL